MTDDSDDAMLKCTVRGGGVERLYLIGSFQVCHHHLNLIGPEEDIHCYSRETHNGACDSAFERQLTNKKQRMHKWREKSTLCTQHVCATVQRAHI